MKETTIMKACSGLGGLPTCASCKYWIKEKDVAADILASYGQWGECQRLSFDKSPRCEIDLDHLGYDGMGDPPETEVTFSTRSDFGCNDHEEE